MSLGEKAQGEAIRPHLLIQGPFAPTGTPQIQITGFLKLADLVSNGAGTGISSAVGGFEVGMVGAYLNMTEAGSGFTLGTYEVTAYADTNNITIGSSAGASKTGGTGSLNGKTILAATNMIQGASTAIWHYDYKIAADAGIGSYQIIKSAVVNGKTDYAVENYDVSINSNVTDGDSEANY